MFGLGKTSDKPSAHDLELLKILDRGQPIDALSSLTEAMSFQQDDLTLADAAICLDASCSLRLASHRDSADVVDYLNSKHSAPLILPGQTVQEFWNNRLKAVPTIAKKLQDEFEKIKKIIETIDEDFGDHNKKFKQLIEDFSREYEHLYDEATIQKTIKMLDFLKKSAIIPYVRRTLFEPIAIQRNRTKTPPGFRDKDNNDGDFYVWVDLLRGLQISKSSNTRFSRVIFVTEDKKDDWTQNGVAHPILSAEVLALSDAQLRIIDVEKLVNLTKADV